MTRYKTPADVRYRPGGDNGLLRWILFREWRERCYWCSTPKRFQDVEIDHILPRTVTAARLDELIHVHGLPAEFDVHAPANLAPICDPCNGGKTDLVFETPIVMTLLRKAAEKQDAVVRGVLRFKASSDAAVQAVLADQQLTSTTEIAMRLGQLVERAQAGSDCWRFDLHTSADGATLVYTERTPTSLPSPAGETVLPPLFDVSGTDPDTVAVRRSLAELMDYGGALTMSSQYLAPTAEGEPSYAEVLGLTEPDSSILVIAGQLPANPAAIPQLVLVADNGHVKGRIHLHPVTISRGQRGGRMILRDGGGIFRLYLQVDRTDDGELINTRFDCGGIIGRYPYEMIATLGHFRQALPTDRLELRLNDRSIGHPDDVARASVGEFLATLRCGGELVAALEQVQGYTGQTFTFPQEFAADECKDLLEAARLVSDRALPLVGGISPLTVPHESITEILQMQDGHLPGRLTLRSGGFYRFTFGPHQIELPLEIHVPDAVLTNAAELRTALDAGVDAVARFRHRDGTGVHAELAPQTS